MEESLLTNFGIAGALLLCIFILGKLWIASNERVQMERVKVDDKRADAEGKKADAFTTAITTLSGKVDNHHTLDIQSHGEIKSGISEIRGKLDEAIRIERATPVEGVQIRPSGGYGPGRPGTGGGR